MLGEIEGGIYISMCTTMSMLLLFTQSSRIRRANVGSHTSFSKVSVFDRLH